MNPLYVGRAGGHRHLAFEVASFAAEVWRNRISLNMGNSRFETTISALPATLTQVDYAAPTGDENTIVPAVTSQIGKFVLHNITRGDDRLIDDVDNTINRIFLTADRPAGWATSDVIHVTSPLVGLIAGTYFYDIDLSGFIPVDAAAVLIEATCRTGVASGSTRYLFHPTEAPGAVPGSKGVGLNAVHDERIFRGMNVVPVVGQRISHGWQLNSTGFAAITLFRCLGWWRPA